MHHLFYGRVGWLGWRTLTRICCWLAVSFLSDGRGARVRCVAARQTSGTQPPRPSGSTSRQSGAQTPSLWDILRAWECKLKVWRHSRGGYAGLVASLMWCSRTSQASRLVPTPSNNGARGRPHTCSTALAVTTALLWGARCTIPRGTRLSRLPRGGRRGRFVSRTMRRGEPRRDGGRLRSGIRLTPVLLSRLHGPRAGGLHCCAASTIGSGRPLTMASAAPALPGSGWSARKGW